MGWKKTHKGLQVNNTKLRELTDKESHVCLWLAWCFDDLVSLNLLLNSLHDKDGGKSLVVVNAPNLVQHICQHPIQAESDI